VETAALYVHIPFCIRKCAYCDFNSYPGMEDLFQPYVDALTSEIRTTSARYPDVRVPTIFFGGGTPTVLSGEQLSGLLGEILGSFRVDSDAEITIEANPGTLLLSISGTLPNHPLLKGGVMSFNRLSLGVQSFDDEELRRLGRIHTSDEAVEAFRQAREAGFRNISIDLMYGVPGQTVESWKRTLGRALDLAPEHISLYSLSIEAGTPFHEMNRAGALQLPGDEAEADMYEAAIQTLVDAGFAHYEISNFARPGFQCRHNITYWKNEPYFGFGAGATSFLNGVRSTRVADVPEYIRRISEGMPPVVFEEHAIGIDAMGETMFLGLRLLEGVNIEDFRRRYGETPTEAFPSVIPGLKERGMIEETGGFIRLTHHGLFFGNDVFEEFVGLG